MNKPFLLSKALIGLVERLLYERNSRNDDFNYLSRDSGDMVDAAFGFIRDGVEPHDNKIALYLTEIIVSYASNYAIRLHCDRLDRQTYDEYYVKLDIADMLSWAAFYVMGDIARAKLKDGIDMDDEAAQTLHAALSTALRATHGSTGNRMTRYIAESALALLTAQLTPDSTEQVSAGPAFWVTQDQCDEVIADHAQAALSLPLPDPEKDRGKYELWARRSNRAEKPLDFLNRVWGKYIDAGALYQTDLRGSKSKRGLDKTLFDAVSQQCRDEGRHIADCIPNKINQIDRELARMNLPDHERLVALALAAARRSRKNRLI